MRSRIAPLLLVPLLCLAPSPARADAGAASPADTVWMTVLLNGRKVGHEEVQRAQQGDTVITTQTLVMDIERNHRRTPYINVSRNVETLDGTPISFTMTTTLSTTQTRVDGQRLADGTLELVNSTGGSSRRSSTEWPAGAVLVEGERLAMQAAIPYPGKHYHLLVYNQASQEAMDLAVEVIGNERVDMPNGAETLSHQRETLRSLDNTQSVDVWLDTQGNIRKGSLSMLGRPLDMIACSETCANAPTQSLNMMDSAVVDSPRSITPEMLADFLTYRVRIHNKAIGKPFIATDEQSVADLGNGEWQINVYRGFIDAQDPPTPADTQPNTWLQSDTPEIKELAALAAGNTSSTLHTMGNLNSFVSRYLTQRGWISAMHPRLKWRAIAAATARNSLCCSPPWRVRATFRRASSSACSTPIATTTRRACSCRMPG